jgi:hypothetical protein
MWESSVYAVWDVEYRGKALFRAHVIPLLTFICAMYHVMRHYESIGDQLSS